MICRSKILSFSPWRLNCEIVELFFFAYLQWITRLECFFTSMLFDFLLNFSFFISILSVILAGWGGHLFPISRHCGPICTLPMGPYPCQFQWYLHHIHQNMLLKQCPPNSSTDSSIEMAWRLSLTSFFIAKFAFSLHSTTFIVAFYCPQVTENMVHEIFLKYTA